MSKRSISRLLNIHRNTITKCIKELENSLKEHQIDAQAVTDWSSVINEYVTESTYDSSKRTKKVLTEEFINFAEEKWSRAKEKNRTTVYLEAREDNRCINNGIQSFGYTTFCEAIKIIEGKKRG